MKCFVIMPFGDPATDPEFAAKCECIYSDWIKPSIEAIKSGSSGEEFISCHRSDKEVAPGIIIDHVVEQLAEADIAVADLTGRNPNVFYELGARHAIKNNTILIAENLEDIPFDLRGHRFIIYKYHPGGRMEFARSLRMAVEGILAKPDRIDNPVRRYLYQKGVEELANRPAIQEPDVLKVLMSEIRDLKDDMSTNFSNMRGVVESVVQSTDQEVGTRSEPTSSIELLKGFEGIWECGGEGAKSTYCAGIADGQLYIPFSNYAQHLTAHYHATKLINETLYMRWDWFETPVYGFAYIRFLNEDTLQGGWWYVSRVPENIQSDISRISDSIPGMHYYEWTRTGNTEDFPEWARRYFDNIEQYRNRRWEHNKQGILTLVG